MNKAIQDVETALYAWLKAKEIVSSGERSISDKRDLSRRLMNLDEAIMRLEHFAGSVEADEVLFRAHRQ